MKTNWSNLIAYPLALSLIVNCFCSFSQPVLNYRRVITSLSAPLEIVNAADGTNRLFVVQKVGSVKVYDSTYNYLGVFVTVSGVTINGERGLLSMAFHPDFKNNGFFFVYYTNTQGDIEISRYTVSNNPNRADTTTRKIIITIPHRAAANHNGGKISFGPDGYLYFATGDGGNGGDPPNNAQNGKVLLGKMLRIDVNNPGSQFNYSIPPDNPFVNDSLIADEIWAMGLRNPFRWSFDRLTHDMWIADVGQGVKEEINFRKAGETKGLNYGWRCYEGKGAYNTSGCKPADQYVFPIFDYTHNLATGGSAVTGGYVYRGKEYPSLNGYYIFADYISNNQWLIKDSSNTWSIKQITPGYQPGSTTYPPNIAGFGEGENGTLYAASLTDNSIYKIEVTSAVQVSILDFKGLASYGAVLLRWRSAGQNIRQYEVESSDDSLHFIREGVVTANNQLTESSYRFSDNISRLPKKYYRLRIVNNDNNWDYSKTIVVTNTTKLPNYVYPTIIRNGIISLRLSDAYDNVTLIGINGSIILNKNIRGFKGAMEIPVQGVAKGIYLLKISNKKGFVTQRVLIE
jgi:glucose/arabinose dehydrogenase